MEVKVITIILGTLLGATISWIAFYFRNKKEVREKINESLFHLLEIWTAVAIIKATVSDDFSSLLIERIKVVFPHENLDSESEKSIKEGLYKFSEIYSEGKTFSNDSLLNKYELSVNNLAKIYPLLAFELNKNQTLIKFLKVMDEVKIDDKDSDTDKLAKESAMSHLRAFFYDESFDELESDLLLLAKKSSFQNKRKTKEHIDRVRKKFRRMPSKDLDNYIVRVIGPMIQKHYDDLGVKNPNI